MDQPPLDAKAECRVAGPAALDALLEATRALLWIRTPTDAKDIAADLVTAFGGTVVPAGSESGYTTAFDSAPGAFCTVRLAAPAEAIVPEATATVSWVALTNFVVSTLPFHCTSEPAVKLEPFTVSVKSGPPTSQVAGLRVVMAGKRTAYCSELESAQGSATEIKALPDELSTAAFALAANCVALTNFVDSAVPFQSTCAPWAKPAPFTVKVNGAPPGIHVAGLSELSVGVGPPAKIVIGALVEASDRLSPL